MIDRGVAGGGEGARVAPVENCAFEVSDTRLLRVAQLDETGATPFAPPKAEGRRGDADQCGSFGTIQDCDGICHRGDSSIVLRALSDGQES